MNSKLLIEEIQQIAEDRRRLILLLNSIVKASTTSDGKLPSESGYRADLLGVHLENAVKMLLELDALGGQS